LGNSQAMLTDGLGIYDFTLFKTGWTTVFYLPRIPWNIPFSPATCAGDSLVLHLPVIGTDAVGNDFAISPLTDPDLAVNIYKGAVRPGFSQATFLYAYNLGKVRPSPVIEWKHDSILQFVSATPAPASYNSIPRAATWFLDTLNAPGFRLHSNQYLLRFYHCHRGYLSRYSVDNAHHQ